MQETGWRTRQPEDPCDCLIAVCCKSVSSKPGVSSLLVVLNASSVRIDIVLRALGMMSKQKQKCAPLSVTRVCVDCRPITITKMGSDSSFSRGVTGNGPVDDVTASDR